MRHGQHPFDLLGLVAQLLAALNKLVQQWHQLYGNNASKWVLEGKGCAKGCAYESTISHIPLHLICAVAVTTYHLVFNVITD